MTTVHPARDTRIFARECRSAVRGGAQVSLIAQYDTASDRVEGVDIIGLPRVAGRLRRRLTLPWLAFVRAYRHRADVYHFHDPELIPAAALLRLLRRGKVVYDVHEYYSEIQALHARPALAGLVRRAVHLAVESLPARFFDALVFPTERLRAEYASDAGSVTLRNLPSRLDPPPDVFASGGEKDIDVAFVGTISPPRLRFMLEVAKLLARRRPGLRWLFLGLAAASEAWVRANYDRDFLDRHVVMVQRVPFDQVLGWLARARVGFNYHPMEKRFTVAIPMKVFEYMYMGMPSVSTALPELAELVADGEEAVMVSSDDPADYAAAVEALLDDPARAARIGAAGRARIVGGLNWEASEQGKLLDLYHRLAGRVPA